MSNVNPSCSQQLARRFRLPPAVFGQIDIGPACKAILEIPLALAMAEQNQLEHRRRRISLFYNSRPHRRPRRFSVQFLIENVFLIAIAFASGAMLLWPLVRNRASGPALTTLQVTQLINGKNATIVDIRSPEEFAKGSLPNARNLPADKLKDRCR